MSDNNVVRKFDNYDRESTMKNVKNMNDIAAIATAKVNELIANGFIFNFGTRGDSLGNDFSADLTKDGITYRVRVFINVRTGTTSKFLKSLSTSRTLLTTAPGLFGTKTARLSSLTFGIA